MDEKSNLIKMIMNTGQVITLYGDSAATLELTNSFRFVKMKDKVNDVYVSIEDVVAFEIISDRPETQEANEDATSETKA